jgi:hypothetical protein
VDTSKLTPGVIVILAAGLITLVFSFFAFYKFDAGSGRVGEAVDDAICDELPDDEADACREQFDDIAEDVGGDESFNAWNNDGLFPLTTLPAIYGLLMAVQVGLATFANVKFPPRVLGLTWAQINIALGLNAALLMLAFLVRDKGPLDFGFGFWLMLLGSLALAVGAFLYQREDASGPAVPPPPPSAPPTA